MPWSLLVHTTDFYFEVMKCITGSVCTFTAIALAVLHYCFAAERSYEILSAIANEAKE